MIYYHGPDSTSELRPKNRKKTEKSKLTHRYCFEKEKKEIGLTLSIFVVEWVMIRHNAQKKKKNYYIRNIVINFQKFPMFRKLRKNFSKQTFYLADEEDRQKILLYHRVKVDHFP